MEALINSIALYEQRSEEASLLGFLEESTLSGRESEKDDDRKSHALTLMTLHSAKGLEFPHVYLVGMEEGVLPHARSIGPGQSIEEERRLCYVGVTRAQTTLTSASPRPHEVGKISVIPSRFLMEMRGDTGARRRPRSRPRPVRQRKDDDDDGESPKRAPSSARRQKGPCCRAKSPPGAACQRETGHGLSPIPRSRSSAARGRVPPCPCVAPPVVCSPRRRSRSSP